MSSCLETVRRTRTTVTSWTACRRSSRNQAPIRCPGLNTWMRGQIICLHREQSQIPDILLKKRSGNNCLFDKNCVIYMNCACFRYSEYPISFKISDICLEILEPFKMNISSLNINFLSIFCKTNLHKGPTWTILSRVRSNRRLMTSTSIRSIPWDTHLMFLSPRGGRDCLILTLILQIVNIIDNILEIEYWKAQLNDLDFEIEILKS